MHVSIYCHKDATPLDLQFSDILGDSSDAVAHQFT